MEMPRRRSLDAHDRLHGGLLEPRELVERQEQLTVVERSALLYDNTRGAHDLRYAGGRDVPRDRPDAE
jgi:hypothetical protein